MRNFCPKWVDSLSYSSLLSYYSHIQHIGVKPKFLLAWTKAEVEIKVWSGFYVFPERRKVEAKV